MTKADWLFAVEFGGLFIVILFFAGWEVVKMRRHAKKREEEKKAEAQEISSDHQN